MTEKCKNCYIEEILPPAPSPWWRTHWGPYCSPQTLSHEVVPPPRDLYILTLVYRFLFHLTSFHGSTPDQYWKGLTDQYIIQCNSEYSTQWPEWPLCTSGHCPGGCSTLKSIQPSHKISERIISHFKIIQQCNYTNLQTQNQLAKYAEFPPFFSLRLTTYFSK